MSQEHLVLFKDVTNGMALYRVMSQAKMNCKVSFSPPEIEDICGITVRFYDAGDKERIEQLAQNNNIQIRKFLMAE